MPLTTIVERYVRAQEWTDELSVDHPARRSTLATRLIADSQSYSLYIETDEEQEVMSVFIYTPFAVPADRISEMARLINLINNKLVLGRLASADDGESNSVQFRASVDFTASHCSREQIEIMVNQGMWSLRHYEKALAAVSFADLSALEAWIIHQQRQDESGPDDVSIEPTLQ